MRAPLILLAFALIGCDSHITGPHQVVDPNAPADPVTPPPADTRPDLTIALHATVSDNGATDAIVQLNWNVTFSGPAQTVHGLSLGITKDGVGYTAETLADTDFTVPSVYAGPNNPAHLSSAVRLPVGVYTFVATVDSMRTITESNENNNTSTITVEVMPNGAG